MKLKTAFLSVLLICVFSVASVGCSSTIPPNSTPPDVETEKEASAPVTEDSVYRTILEEYAEKLRDATPGLIEEYGADAETFLTDVTEDTDVTAGLLDICSGKIAKLAEVSNEGITAMAQVMYTAGTSADPESFSQYEQWAGQLQDIYMEESSKITEVYLDSIPG